MNRSKFLEEINRIFRIVLIQKAIQLILRAAWIGGSVYLICWGTNQLWGWFPNQRSWVFIALSAALLIIGSIFLVTQPSKKFVWQLDRGYLLHEQVYTLFEVIHTNDEDQEKSPGIKSLFESHDIARLPTVRREIVDKGWRVKEEFEATLVVLILLLIVYLTSVSSIIHIPTGGEVRILPVLGVDPSADQVFASGIPGDLGNGQGVGLPSDGSEVVGLPSSLDLSPLEWTQVSQLMRGLGNKLREESGTYELGQALVQENYKEAANQFGNLAENVDDLTTEVQARIASLFLDTAVGLQNLQQRRISGYFQESSAALYEGISPRISEKFDNLADLMELFSQFQAREMRADVDTGPLSSLQRPLDQFQNNLFTVEEVDDLPDYISSPNVNGSDSQEVLGESLDFIMPIDSNIIEGVWLPFQYSLEDSDVVSSYFSPR